MTEATTTLTRAEGHKDRYAMLPPVLLERLRAWWRYAHAQGKMLKGGWLFPGQNPLDPLTPRQLNRAVHAAAVAARIDKLSLSTFFDGVRPVSEQVE